MEVLFHFNSGRHYNRGQRITVVESEGDVFFIDHSRMVTGKLDLSKVSGEVTPANITHRTVMYLYDGGHYDYASWKHVEKADYFRGEEYDHLFKNVNYIGW